mmetsp:Transcript_2532/g.5831  ORF Transcript_2532/g.5831 Transcript_2532/m.5831 type:complete len:269 (+) Transcript_2532:78-884(+)|eukprot:CAMPEP_0170609200 /NCGR_PEP_ID=MMETSP0224-20130122/21995_1 /TAXON_ID=285029 /ORGANISM="Togula jolla, Strain CCCM 725" /LENGTH=268 /DNA_ID=CAMNT_0010934485 /DNA_START=78 /DNA_END=884 /DNA_ORIENTATION=+
MSASVYAVHAAQWARQNHGICLREVLNELGHVLARGRSVKLSEERYVAVYSTMAEAWSRQQAALIPVWRHCLQTSCVAVSTWTTPLRRWSKRHPLLTGATAATLNATLSDVLVQRYLEQKDRVNLDRTLIFALFGFAWVGCFQYGLYTHLFPEAVRMSGLTGARSVALQVLGDQAAYMPAMYMPMYYFVKTLAEAPPQSGTQAVAEEAMQRYRRNISSDMKLCVLFWVPTQVFNFTFVPVSSRVPFLCAAGFLWCMGIGASSSGSKTE